MTKTISCIAAISLLALPAVHPFGNVRRQHSTDFLAGVQLDNSTVLPLIERACQNCHSQRTEWPLYSYLPAVSWALEKDVVEARQHLDFSRWDQYSTGEKRDLLARMGAEVRNHRMPVGRYVLLHPEARLSEAEILAIYEWTKAERRAIRESRE